MTRVELPNGRWRPAYIEVWDLYRSIRCRHCRQTRANPRTRFVGAFEDMQTALAAANLTRKNVRVRSWYSRSRRAQIIQIITGHGFSVREH